MSTILRSQILDTITVCPYCMNEVGSEQLGCCGESGSHFAQAYLTEDAAYRCDETEVIEDEGTPLVTADVFAKVLASIVENAARDIKQARERAK